MEFEFELVKQNLLKTVYMIMKAVNFLRQFYRIILLSSSVTFDFFFFLKNKTKNHVGGEKKNFERWGTKEKPG